MGFTPLDNTIREVAILMSEGGEVKNARRLVNALWTKVDADSMILAFAYGHEVG